MELAVGELVVYGNHGVGRIAARKKQKVLGSTQEVLVIELDDLTATVPLELAQTHLRPLADEDDVRHVRQALRDDSELSTQNWLSRRRETLDKLTTATPVELAEIVSEGAQRERLLVAKGGGKQNLSPSEREAFGRARKLLSGELAVVLELEPEAAEGWIDEQLARPA